MTKNKSFTVNFPVDKRGYVSEVTRDFFFKKIKTKSENRFCMDCKKASPSWVSVTYGTFICLTCSGSHRRMGTHISFVRSTELDNFTRKELARIDLGGNSRFIQFMKSHGLYTDNIDYKSKIVALYKTHLDNLIEEEFNVENDETKEMADASVNLEFLPIDFKNNLPNECLHIEPPIEKSYSINEQNSANGTCMIREKDADSQLKSFYILKPNARKTKCDGNKSMIMQDTSITSRATRLEDNFDFSSLQKKASDMSSPQVTNLESNFPNNSNYTGMAKCAFDSSIPSKFSNVKSISSKNVIPDNEMTKQLGESDSQIAHNLQFYRNSKAISSSMILQNGTSNHDLDYEPSLISNKDLHGNHQYSSSVYTHTYNSARQISTGVHETVGKVKSWVSKFINENLT